MSLEKAEEYLTRAIQEIETSTEYNQNNKRTVNLLTAISHIENTKKSLYIDPDTIKDKIAKSVKVHTDKVVRIEIEFSYDSIYPYARITSNELSINEMWVLSEKVTEDVYTEEMPVVVII